MQSFRLCLVLGALIRRPLSPSKTKTPRNVMLFACPFLHQVFPYNNPAETYRYHSLPFCSADHEKERQRFGESLVGNRKVGCLYAKQIRGKAGLWTPWSRESPSFLRWCTLPCLLFGRFEAFERRLGLGGAILSM